MGVLTSLHRVPTSVAEKIVAEPNLVDVLEYPDEHEPAELGLDASPPTDDVDKAWEEILRLLDGVGHRRAAEALVTGADLETDTGAEVRVIAAATVKNAAASFAAIDLDKLAAAALANEVTDYYGKVLDRAMAGYVASQIRTLVKFWERAAAADEAVVVVTS